MPVVIEEMSVEALADSERPDAANPAPESGVQGAEQPRPRLGLELRTLIERAERVQAH
jgi:hypothetical protein